MEYMRTVDLKDGRKCTLRHGTGNDGREALEAFIQMREETDYLLTYPEENTSSVEDEIAYLEKKAGSEREMEIVAEVDGELVGMAGISAVGDSFKVRHRAELGISVIREFWHLGIGRALMDACVECAKDAGYEQIELSVVADNERAVTMYKKDGFVEFGRNPRGFKSRISGYQELIYMRKEL
ncbi:MAG: GNAT family N-acetyltransferase [Clostridia bacterium]|nr:GNAT family N-acetyltransferase [Clostridia bacterium]